MAASSLFLIGKVTDESLKLVALNCSELQSLDVSHTGGMVTDESIKLIVINCRDLQSVTFNNTEGKITDASLSLLRR